MKIAVLGTGMVGRAIAGRLAELGHRVTVGTRDLAVTAAKDEYAAWARQHRNIALASFADAAEEGEFVVNATSGGVSLDVLKEAGGDNLAGKVLLDVANYLDFSGGFPPTLGIDQSDSLGEQLQRAFPDARVVKSLNTLTADLMVHPHQLGEATTVFVSGDDIDAKSTVMLLLASFGHSDIVDLGDITTARGVEWLMPAWLRLTAALGTSKFNWRVVR